MSCQCLNLTSYWSSPLHKALWIRVQGIDILFNKVCFMYECGLHKHYGSFSDGVHYCLFSLRHLRMIEFVLCVMCTWLRSVLNCKLHIENERAEITCFGVGVCWFESCKQGLVKVPASSLLATMHDGQPCVAVYIYEYFSPCLLRLRINLQLHHGTWFLYSVHRHVCGRKCR